MRSSYSLVLLGCSLLFGCASGGLGLAESPTWHATASLDSKVEYFQKKCAAYGTRSDEMSRCVQSAMEKSEGNANARAAAIGAGMSQMNQQSQQSRPITCNTYGNTTRCY